MNLFIYLNIQICTCEFQILYYIVTISNSYLLRENIYTEIC